MSRQVSDPIENVELPAGHRTGLRRSGQSPCRSYTRVFAKYSSHRDSVRSGGLRGGAQAARAPPPAQSYAHFVGLFKSFNIYHQMALVTQREVSAPSQSRFTMKMSLPVLRQLPLQFPTNDCTHVMSGRWVISRNQKLDIQMTAECLITCRVKWDVPLLFWHSSKSAVQTAMAARIFQTQKSPSGKLSFNG